MFSLSNLDFGKTLRNVFMASVLQNEEPISESCHAAGLSIQHVICLPKSYIKSTTVKS